MFYPNKDKLFEEEDLLLSDFKDFGYRLKTLYAIIVAVVKKKIVQSRIELIERVFVLFYFYLIKIRIRN